MKRSEMILKMVHDTFHELAGERINTPEFPYKVAELMLEVCEKEGMLPPPYVNTELGDHMNFYEINQWEEE